MIIASRRPSALRGSGLIVTTLTIAAMLLAFAGTANALTTPQVASNFESSCALHDVGTIKCWGTGLAGQLGNGTNTNSSTPVDVAGINNAIGVATGDDVSCALIADGTVRCWGSDLSGALGDGPGNVDSNVPVTVVGVADAVQVSGTERSFCALIRGGTVNCWGRNGNHQFGTADTNDRESAVQVPGIAGAVKVASGVSTTCVLIADGTVKCLGSNWSGEIGDPAVPAADSASPVSVVGVSGAIDIGSSSGYSCALLQSRTMKCWGANGDGQLGNGDASGDPQPTPVDVAGVSNVAGFSIGWQSVCALILDGTVRCWGNGSAGELGDGAGNDSLVPVTVAGLTGVHGIGEMSEDNHCAWVTGGAVYCWGDNYSYQSGHPDASFNALTPFQVPNIDLITQPWPATGPAVAVTNPAMVNRKKTTYTVTGTTGATPSAFVTPAEACAGPVAISVTYKYAIKKAIKPKKKKRAKKKSRKSDAAVAVSDRAAAAKRKRSKKKKKTRYRKIIKQRTVTASAPLAVAGGSCGGAYTLTLPVKHVNGRSIVINAVFAGNGNMQAWNATATHKLQKVKPAKKKTKKKKSKKKKKGSKRK